MIPKGIGMPSASPHPVGMTPDEYARRRLLLAQRGGLFRGPIPTSNAAAIWRNFSSNLSSDARQYGYANPVQFMQDSARMGAPTNAPRFLGGGAMNQPGPVGLRYPGAGGMEALSPFAQSLVFDPGRMAGARQQIPAGPAPAAPMQGFMAVEQPAIKQLLVQALASLNSRPGFTGN